MQAVPLEEIGAEVDVLGFWVPRVLDAGVQAGDLARCKPCLGLAFWANLRKKARWLCVRRLSRMQPERSRDGALSPWLPVEVSRGCVPYLLGRELAVQLVLILTFFQIILLRFLKRFLYCICTFYISHGLLCQNFLSYYT